jgi:hypothetical protein
MVRMTIGPGGKSVSTFQDIDGVTNRCYDGYGWYK